MVKALLDGRKTQTRRVIKPQPLACETEFWCVPEGWFGVSPSTEDRMATRGAYFQCPYGTKGDGLWVQEAWSSVFESVEDGGIGGDVPIYKATFAEDREFDDADEVSWLHGQRMPRWASRIDLEITGVRVERLQEISEADAEAEGIRVLPLQNANDPSAWWESAPGQNQGRTPVESFRKLWQSINGPESWAANPWCWVVEFKLAERRRKGGGDE